MTVLAIILAVFSLGWYLEARHYRTENRALRQELTLAMEQAAFYAAENDDLRDGIQQLADASQSLLNEVRGIAAIVPPPGGLVA